jgi:hypothetical protein
MKRLLIFLLVLSSACTKAQSGILGVMSTPTPVVYDTVYTSEAGLVSDADLSMFSTTYGTDQTAALQSLLDMGGNPANPLVIYVDGRYSASQLKVKSHTTLIGVDSGGFIQRPGIAKPFVVNYNRSGTTRTDENITLQNLVINGSGHLSDGTNNRGYHSAEGFSMVASFRGTENVTLSGCTFRNGRIWMVYFSNSVNPTVENCTIAHSMTYTDQGHVLDVLGHDGIGFGGPCSGVTVTGNSIASYDDAIALKCNDGMFPNVSETTEYSGIRAYDPYTSYGDISVTEFSNNHFEGALHGIRILTKSHSITGNTVINGLTGTVGDFLLAYDDLYGYTLYGSGATASNGSVTLQNVDVTVTGADAGHPYPNTTAIGCNVAGVMLSLENVNIVNTVAGRSILKTIAPANLGTLNINDLTVGGVLLTNPDSRVTIGGTIGAQTGDYF